MVCCNTIIAFYASLYHVHIYTSRLKLIKRHDACQSVLQDTGKDLQWQVVSQFWHPHVHMYFWDEPQRVKGPNKGNLYSYTSQSYKKNLRSSGCLKPVHQFLWASFPVDIKCKPHGKCWHWQEQDTTPGIGMDSVVCLKRGYSKFFCWILTRPLGLPFKGSVYGIVRYSNV